MNIFVEESHAVPVVHIAVAFEGGFVHDTKGEEGPGYITARMLRRGAGGMTGSEIEARLDRLGADLDEDVGQHVTKIHLTVLRRSLTPAVELLVSLLTRPTFAPEALQRLLREVEAQVVEASDDDGWLAGRECQRALFGAHPYGSVMTAAAVRALTPDHVARFYRTFYGQVEAVAVAGDVTFAEVNSLVRLLPHASSLLDSRIGCAEPPVPTPRPGRHLVFVDKPERTQHQIRVATMGTHAHDPDHVALLVANAAFGGSFNSRLMEEVRGKRGWSYGAHSGLSTDRQRQAFTVSVAPKVEDGPACLALVIQMLEELRERGLTAAELARTRRMLVRGHAFAVETAAQRVGQKLSTFLYRHPEGHYDRFVERVEAVTLEEVNAAVRLRLSTADLVVAAVGTGAQRDALAAAIPDLASSEVVPFDA